MAPRGKDFEIVSDFHAIDPPEFCSRPSSGSTAAVLGPGDEMMGSAGETGGKLKLKFLTVNTIGFF
jgi:hypothetical protein